MNAPQQTKKVALPRRLLGALVSVLAALCFLELGGRALTTTERDPGLARVVRDFPHLEERAEEDFRFVPDRELSYRLRPGFVRIAGTQVTTHNAEGFREARSFPPRDPGRPRIVCVGGSTTYGAGVEDNRDTYPAALERALRRLDGRPWEVFNLGIGGYTSREVRLNYQRHGRGLEAGLVLIQSAINDVAPRFYPGFKCDYSHFRRPLTLPARGGWRHWAYQSRLVLLVGYHAGWLTPLTLQDRTQPPWPSPGQIEASLAQNGPACYREHIRGLIEDVRADGSAPVLLTQAYLEHPDFAPPPGDSEVLEACFRQGLAEHNQVLRELSAELDIPLIDLAREMPAHRRSYSDPIHHTAAGNATKARIIAEFLHRLPAAGGS